MNHNQSSKKIIDRLRRIEGQVRGIQNMVAEDRYCIDVLTQLTSIVAALEKVEDIMMRRHLETCVTTAIQSGSEREQQEKIGEVMEVLSRFRKYGSGS